MPVIDDIALLNDGLDWDDNEQSDFSCIECGEDLGDGDVCENEGCELFEAPTDTNYSDYESRQHERKQMGIGG